MKISARSTRATVTGTKKIPIDVLNNYYDGDNLAEYATRYFNVKDQTYGAYGDLQTVLDGVATSGSAIITSALNLFVAADVGKRVAISGAGAAGAPLRGSIITFNSAGSVTISVSASTSVTAAMIDWGHDDTVAIQLAMNACRNAFSGVVFFPRGAYMIDGNLQTSISGTNPNAQLYIISLVDSSRTLGSIRLVGESAFLLPCLRVGLEKSGVILKSTRVGSGTNPCVLGSIGLIGNYLSYNYCDVHTENIEVLVYTNNGASPPSMTGIDFRHIGTVKMKNTSASVDVGINNCASPASAEFAGIIVGQRDNNGPNILETCSATGFKYNFVLGEHTVLHNVYSFAGYYGAAIPRQNYLVQGQLLTHYCRTQILFVNTQILGIDHDAAKYCRCNLVIEMENDISGKWWDTVYTIDDIAGVAFGELRFMFLSGGAIRNDLGLAAIIGAVNLQIIPTDGWQVLSGAIGANTNNYAPTNIAIADTLILTPSGAFNLTGVAPVFYKNKRLLTIVNASATNTLTIKTEDTNSSSFNRFLMNADFALLPNMTARFFYDTAAASGNGRWRKLS